LRIHNNRLENASMTIYLVAIPIKKNQCHCPNEGKTPYEGKTKGLHFGVGFYVTEEESVTI